MTMKKAPQRSASTHQRRGSRADAGAGRIMTLPAS
jgi:hypothetical protein